MTYDDTKMVFKQNYNIYFNKKRKTLQLLTSEKAEKTEWVRV